jgi:hypothetical protein
MTNIPTEHTDRKTKLPDIYVETQGDRAVIVANKRARRLINEHVDPPLPWWRIHGSDYLKSPEYRCVAIENGPISQLTLAIAHQGGMRAEFLCSDCDRLHVVNDEMAEKFVTEAAASAEANWVGAHPGVGTRQ